MPDPIRESVAIARPVVEGARWKDKLHRIISRYTTVTTSLLVNVNLSERMRKEILRYYAKDIVMMSNLTGLKTAKPILKALQSPIEAVRGKALAGLKSWTAKNVAAFEAELDLAKVTLDGEMRAAFFRAKRDALRGDARAVEELAANLSKANRAEMAATRKANARIASARRKLAKAERVGNKVTVAAARVEMTKAKAAARATESMLGRFETAVQGSTRDSVRRQMARAQKAQYQQSLGVNVKRYWVTVNGPAACPTCEERHLLLCPDDTGGEPGGGQTFCGASCMCHAAPQEFLAENPIPKPLVA